MKILAGIDFTNVSDAVVEKSIEYSLAFNAKLWLVHIAPHESNEGVVVGGPRVIRNYKTEYLKESYKKLKAYADSCSEKGVLCIPLLVRGTTIETLLEVLNKLNVNLVVVGSHHQSSLYDFVIGNVRTELLNNSKTPLLVVPCSPK